MTDNKQQPRQWAIFYTINDTDSKEYKTIRIAKTERKAITKFNRQFMNAIIIKVIELPN